ncbi:LysR family transcriptional regulator [Mesorhizobium sp. M7A.F.Ca.MR.245.00.0.0]|uniref:LysR substrate-binding domain-containing protein n=1 Tax=Mesorhizobium sp. M7A.F.Ca.MR.245.00.0.0 TaxID=2496778 RepID=UPI000FC9E7D8|nr:LysR family transcriptional regulator [Mesorhizobium sp. M7A.F.Ca.MR.245.00.0.0]RUV21073.1 LysR family transcriptional regulator [Mesorhizobium sp. M7A.F.Ca.MR.245.00.0.0]RUV50761.1 LysR family transcriptional regulator [Mesorhizobium sp. M7A.F.Ca.MR.228.00.0.0]
MREALKPLRQANNTLRRLDHVFAAVDHGSLRQAARVLRVRESCVSRNIVALEQLLDMQLFDRDVHGVRLTEAGRAWIDLVRAHYEGLHDALAGGGRGHQDAKTVRIGFCAQMGRAFVVRLIDRFRSLHPDVSVAIEDIPHEQCLAAIRRRRVDIVFTHGLENASLCRSEIVAHERLFVLLPVGHPLAERPAVTWADLADTCLLIPVGSPQDPVLLEKIASDGGPTIQVCRASDATVILRVQLGQGVTLAGEGFAGTVAIDATVWKPISGQSSTSSIKAVWLESNPKRALLRLVGTASNMVTATS